MSTRLLRSLLAVASLFVSVAYTSLSQAASPEQTTPPETAFEDLPPGNASLDSPASTRTGSVIEISANGFSANTSIALLLMGPGPSAVLLPVVDGQAVTDSKGRAHWKAQVPKVLTTSHDGTWWLNADDADGHFVNQKIVVVGVEVRTPDSPAVAAAPQPAVVSVTDAAPSPPVAGPTAVPLAPPADGQPLEGEPTVASTEPSPVPTATPRPAGTWAYVTDQPDSAVAEGTRTLVTSVALRIRSGPSADTTLLGTVASGSRLEIIDGPYPTEVGDFYQVRLADGTTGYVAPLSSDIPSVTAASSGTGTLFRLRMQPSTQSPIRALVPEGTLVEVLVQVEGEGGDTWSHVELQLPPTGETVDGYLPTSALQFVE